MYYLSYIFILLSCVNARYLQTSDIPTPVPTPVPISSTPVTISPTVVPISPTPAPISPTPAPISPTPIITDQPIPVPVPPSEIIINPTPPSIDPSMSKQLIIIHKLCVGTFVISFLMFAIILSVLGKVLCFNNL